MPAETKDRSTRPTKTLSQQSTSCAVDERKVTAGFFFRETVSRSVLRGSQRETKRGAQIAL